MKKYSGALCIIFTFFSVVSFLWGGGQALAASSSAWSRFGEVVVHDTYQPLGVEVFDAFWKSHMGVHARQSCQDAYLGMTASYLAYDCWYSSTFGVSGTYGNIIRPEGAALAGLLGETAEKRFIPTPKEGVFLVLIPQEGGFSLQFRTLSSVQIEVIKQEGDFVFYDFAQLPTASLLDDSAQSILVDDNAITTGVWYAKNGRYMLVANMARGEVSRIDLETFRILTTTYTIPEDDEDRFASFDITSDGKYIVANVFGRQPRLLNLDSCASAEQNYVSSPAMCVKRLLGTAIRNFDDQTGGLGNFAVFEDDSTIAFYTNVGQEEYSKFLLFAPGTWQSGNRYIAMGDSFASGEGVGNYYRGTDQIDGNMCHLSRSSYPYLLANSLRLSNARSVACSGAKIQNIIGPEKIDNEVNDWGRSNQYKMNEVDISLGDWTPGRWMQGTYISNENPDIITISISGNDMNFGNVIENCVNPLRKEQTCYRSHKERAKLVNNMDDQYERLVQTYQSIQKSARFGARIYAIGYPSTIKVGGDCAFNVKANSEEIEFLDAYTKYANRIIEKAARRAGVVYVDMTDSLNGFRLCEGSSVKAMNGLTMYGKSERKYINPDSYHPNRLGHSLFAQHIRKETDNFTIRNPRPDLSETRPGAYDAVYAGLFNSVDEALEGGYIYYYEAMTGLVLEKNLRTKTRFPQNQYNTTPGGKYQHWLHSDPVLLSESVADEQGNIEFDIAIPADTPTGVHTLKTIGKNINGADIEIWSTIYVAHTSDDWDGNGVPNNQQTCPITIFGATLKQQKEWCGGLQKDTADHRYSHESHKKSPNKNKGAKAGKAQEALSTSCKQGKKHFLKAVSCVTVTIFTSILVHLNWKHKHETIL